MAIEYISYERFVNEISNDRKKETIIRYENNEYKFCIILDLNII